jgi:hypothetical protein
MKAHSGRNATPSAEPTQRSDVPANRATPGSPRRGVKGHGQPRRANDGPSRRRPIRPRVSPATFALGFLTAVACFPPSPPLGAAENAGDADPTVETLLVFGGPAHNVFLGCLCSPLDPDSIDNPSGPHGGLSSNESVRNRQGPYGSPGSAESACNMAASEPPIVVDRAGGSRGRLSVNPYKARDHDLMTRAQRICEGE